ncbi:hypothetical protein COEREDRAFT_9658 [Coemansia reversa NRRL 1564]|uniref:Uncharacterized protein n=1 Tax=Coemansia reversa (strain ATCC 12441 / NRRL 1564) TaxID=763665 RepID=A0A2G5B8G8_COERN|nr:hypothetical protein COEREDRAFT_9658 [Coemansia reversa NRRL 1564]|eukprot:PIA15280.1 hypothetical protein COEREDRAFT_9658 [Coemansia reversa NRRL 1564]
MYSGILANNARPHPENRRGDPVDAPLFFTRTFVIPTTNDWATIGCALYNIVLQDDICGPYTQPNHLNTVALPNVPDREIAEARSHSHYSNWTWDRPDAQTPQHPFKLWDDMKVTRNFLLTDPEILKIPQFAIPDAALTPKNKKERTSWLTIQQMSALPSARSTIRRLCLNRMPD